MFFWKKSADTVPERPVKISSVELRDGIIFKIRHNLSDALACKQTLVILFGKSVAEL